MDARKAASTSWLVRDAASVSMDCAEIGIFGDAAVARQHAEIESTPSGYVLHQLAPKASTRVNGKPVAGHEPFLNDGDRIELGQTLLVFRQRLIPRLSAV